MKLLKRLKKILKLLLFDKIDCKIHTIDMKKSPNQLKSYFIDTYKKKCNVNLTLTSRMTPSISKFYLYLTNITFIRTKLWSCGL